MATLETQKLDQIIASRRSLLVGASALAATAIAGPGKQAAAAVPTSFTDFDILNFALNLEYLEAQYYTLATEGVTADKSTLGSAISINGGVAAVQVKANPKVTFSSPAVAAYAFETALEERKHVTFLQSAITSNKGTAVAQPQINLQSSFTALGTAIGSPTFDPFTTDLGFLLGAYIFEDVGVTAYHGGALAITNKGANGGLDVLTPAASIHAVEAYHAGLVRVTLALVDAGILSLGTGNPGQGQAINITNAISNVRAMADGTYGQAPAATDTVGLTGQDDFGLATYTVTLNGAASGTASRIMDQGRTTAPGYSNFIGFHRTLQQVLNIVYISGTGAISASSFFPKGLNGNIN